jgi:hypothetical protein
MPEVATPNDAMAWKDGKGKKPPAPGRERLLPRAARAAREVIRRPAQIQAPGNDGLCAGL